MLETVTLNLKLRFSTHKGCFSPQPNTTEGTTKRTKFKKISIRYLAAKVHVYGRLSPYPSPFTFWQSFHFPLQNNFWRWSHVSHKAEFQQFLSKIGLQKMNLKTLSQVSERSCVKVLCFLLLYTDVTNISVKCL